MGDLVYCEWVGGRKSSRRYEYNWKNVIEELQSKMLFFFIRLCILSGCFIYGNISYLDEKTIIYERKFLK